MATYYKGDGTQITIPASGSVNTAQLVDNAVTYGKLAEAVQDKLDEIDVLEAEMSGVSTLGVSVSGKTLIFSDGGD